MKSVQVLWVAASIANVVFCGCKKNVVSGVSNTFRAVQASYNFEDTPAWLEDFTGTTIDKNVWQIYAPGIGRDGYNDTTTMSFDGDNFIDKVYSDTIDGIATHHTGMIRTRQEFKYGKIEARISYVNTSGSWSAFWLQSPTMGDPVGNPQAAGMEIDVVETLPDDGAAHHNLHWDGYGANLKSAGFITRNLGVNGGNYHIYTLEWTPAYYKFYVDGSLTWTYSDNVSQRSEFIIISSEVQNNAVGTWAGPVPANGFGSLDRTATIMKVDYVKWYKLKQMSSPHNLD